MPLFGQAHRILSTLHLDTEVPAGGAEPSDGQVLTYVAAQQEWAARDPAPGGVTVHGLLTGLDADDHLQYALADKSRPTPWVAAADLAARSIADLGTRAHDLLTGLDADDHLQYALADKSRPDPWVAAGDLAARSIADLGTRAHDLLTGLSDDDHPQYPLLAGRNGGQTLIGGQAASEHLTLQSTAHATRGYVRAQDDLQLLSGKLRDSGGNERITLATTSPHMRLKDDVIIGRLIVGGKTAAPYWVGTYRYFYVQPDDVTVNDHVNLISGNPMFTVNANKDVMAIGMNAVAQWNAGYSGWLKGLLFSGILQTNNEGTVSQMRAIDATLMSSGIGVITDAKGCYLRGLWYGEIPVTACGLQIDNFGASGMTTVYGLKIADQTLATNKYIIEAGPANPYLRLYGGADPIAGFTNLALKVGSTLYTIRTRTINGYTALTID